MDGGGEVRLFKIGNNSSYYFLDSFRFVTARHVDVGTMYNSCQNAWHCFRSRMLERPAVVRVQLPVPVSL